MQAQLEQFGSDEGASGAGQSPNDGSQPSVRVTNGTQHGAVAPLGNEIEPPTPQVCYSPPALATLHSLRHIGVK